MMLGGGESLIVMVATEQQHSLGCASYAMGWRVDRDVEEDGE